MITLKPKERRQRQLSLGSELVPMVIGALQYKEKGAIANGMARVAVKKERTQKGAEQGRQGRK